MKKRFISAIIGSICLIGIAGASQYDYNISAGDANTGSTMRAQINAGLQALASSSSGATAPATTYAFQFWADTASGFLKIRNQANNAWVSLFPLAIDFTAAPTNNAPVLRGSTGKIYGNFSGAYRGNLIGNVTGAVTGNATTATTATSWGTLGTAPDQTNKSGQVLTTNGAVTSWAIVGASKGPVRQTVLSAGTDANGYANFITTGSGLAPGISATATPLVISFASGFGSDGTIDYIGAIAADTTVSVSANSTNYIYAERNSSTAAITLGYSLYKPQYGITWKEVSVPGPVGTSVTVWGDGKPSFATRDSAGFDGVTSQTAAAAAATTTTITPSTGAVIGKSWTGTKVIVGFNLTGASDSGFVATDSPVVSATLQAWDGSSWINIGSSYVTDSAGAVISFLDKTITTAYSGHRVLVTHDGGTARVLSVAECEFLELPTGQHWFNSSSFLMKSWNGSSWDTVQRVFLGEAVAAAGSISSVTSYALQGKYVSDDFAASLNTLTYKNHNIGDTPSIIKSFLVNQIAEAGYSPGELAEAITTFAAAAARGNGPAAINRLAYRFNMDSAIPYITSAATPGLAATTAAKWKVRVYMQRGW